MKFIEFWNKVIPDVQTAAIFGLCLGFLCTEAHEQYKRWRRKT